MRERLAELGRPGSRHRRSMLPPCASSATSGRGSRAESCPGSSSRRWPSLVDLARTLPGGYRFVAVRDLAGGDRVGQGPPDRAGELRGAIETGGHDGPLPGRLFAPLYRRYEAAKARAGRIDFEDMLEMTVRLIEDDAGVPRSRSATATAGSASTSTRTRTPLQQALLDAWLGGRDDLAVVGDEDQTIYTFTGASSEWLTGFTGRYPEAKVVRLETNYRSTPQVLELANRLLRASRGGLGGAAQAPGRRPGRAGPRAGSSAQLADGSRRRRAIAAEARRLIAEGVPAEQIAVLVRTNGQLVGFEAAFRAAGVPFQVRGERFFAARRSDVDRAVALDRGPRPSRRIRCRSGASRGDGERALEERTTDSSRGTWARALDFQPDEVPAARRPASATARCSRCSRSAASSRSADPAADTEAFLAEVGRRTAAEAEGTTGSGRGAPDLPPGQGPRVGRRLPPRARGGDPADPPGQRARRDRGGAPAPLRRDHPRPGPPVALLRAGSGDGSSTDRRRSRFLLEVMPSPARSSRDRGRSRPAGR